MKLIPFFFISLLFCIHLPAQNANWVDVIGSYNNETCGPVCADENNNVYTAGTYWDTLTWCNTTLPRVRPVISSNLPVNIFFTSLDANGNCKWVKPGISLVPPVSGGAIASQVLRMQYFHGFIYCTGLFTDTLIIDQDTLYNSSCNSYCTSIFVMKMDTDGVVAWAKCIQGATGYSFAGGLVVCISGFYFAGSFQDSAIFGTTILTSTNSSNFKNFLAKLDFAGNYRWAEQIGVPLDAGIRDMAYDSAAGLYMIGDFMDTIIFPSTTLTETGPSYMRGTFITRYDTSGNFVWARGGIADIGGQLVNAAITCNRGKVFATGIFTDSIRVSTTSFTTPPGSYHAVLFGMDTSGQFTWVKQNGNRPAIQSFADIIAPRSTAGFSLFYDFSDTLIFGNDTLVANGNAIDIVYTLYDANGNAAWSKQIGGPGQEIQNGSCMANGFIWLTARTMNNYLVDGIPVVNQGGGDALVVQLKDPGTPEGMTEIFSVDNFSVFPNPADDVIRIAAAEAMKNATVRIVDMQGRVVLENNGVNGNTFAVNVAGISRGVYLLEVVDGEKTGRTKFIKQ